MAIETKDLVIRASERLTDTSDGGGKDSGREIVDGLSNNLFDDISELNRAMGDVGLRKVYAAVKTDDTDALMGATVFISELPKDPNVSALLFSTDSWTDERLAAQNRIENYLAKGAQAAGTPLDTHWQGMKTLEVAMFPREVENNVGDTIVLISNEGKSNQIEQYLYITKVDTRTAIMIVNGKEVEYKIASYEVSDPLATDFVGLSAQQWYDGAKSTSIIRNTMVADTGRYYSSVALTTDAEVGEYTVNAASIFAQLVPSAQSETLIVDVNAAGEDVALVSGNADPITVGYTTRVSTTNNLYIGSSVYPGSVSFSVFGQSVTDQGGLLKTTSGTQVGIVDYQRGLIQWTDAAGTGNTTLSITFKPAAAPQQYYQTHSIPVTQNNRAANWTGVLVPTPAPGALSVSYMAQGKFYELRDDGTGQLIGASPSYGSGRINYETGSWSLTTGELADVGTPILLLWGTPIATFERANLPVAPAKVEFELNHQAVASGSVVVTWLLNGNTKTATSNASGQFTGDATGYINYAAGKGYIIPNLLPQKGTVFNFAYSYGDPKSQTIPSNPDAGGELTFTVGTGAPIQPNSIEIEVPVNGNHMSTLILTDRPIDEDMGDIVDPQGNVQGSIVYDTGIVVVRPSISVELKQTTYEMISYISSGPNGSI